MVMLLSPYPWIPDEDVLRTWQQSIHHPLQVIHHQQQAEEQHQASESPGASGEHYAPNAPLGTQPNMCFRELPVEHSSD